MNAAVRPAPLPLDHPGPARPGFARRLRVVTQQANDITKAMMPILKVVGVVVVAVSIAWWARGLQGSVESVATDVAELSNQVGEVLRLQDKVSSNESSIGELQRQLTSLQDDYKVLQLKYDRLDKDFAVATATKGD